MKKHRTTIEGHLVRFRDRQGCDQYFLANIDLDTAGWKTLEDECVGEDACCNFCEWLERNGYGQELEPDIVLDL